MTKNEFSKYVDEMNENIRRKLKNSKEQLEFYSILVNTFNKVCEENIKQKEVIDKITEIINYYGIDEEHNDDLILRHILKNMLNILKEVSE